MKRGWRTTPFEGDERGVEALEVADLQHPPAAHRQLDELLRLLERRGERLLDQHVDAALQEVARHRVVVLRRDGDARAVDAAEQLAVVGERLHAEGRRDLAGARLVDVGDPDQLGAALRAVLLGVEAPEVSHADDGGSDGAHGSTSPGATATTAIPAASASAIISARSRMIVRPASSASARPPTSRWRGRCRVPPPAGRSACPASACRP
jgi:hypothetical protein